MSSPADSPEPKRWTIYVCPVCGEQFSPEQAEDVCNKDGHQLADVTPIEVVEFEKDD